MTRMSDGPLNTPLCALHVVYVLCHVTKRARRSPATLVTVAAIFTTWSLASSLEVYRTCYIRLCVDTAAIKSDWDQSTYTSEESSTDYNLTDLMPLGVMGPEVRYS